jgi:hypothetical protein
MPPDADLLLWEFAINNCGCHVPEESRVLQERSALSAWSHEVEKIWLRPPKVALICSWKNRFELNGNQQVNNPAFALHA